MTSKQKAAAKHGLFWIIFFLYEWLAFASLEQEACSGIITKPYEAEFYYSLVYVPVLAAVLYFTLYVLIEQLYVSGRYSLFFTLLTATLLAGTVIYRAITYTFLIPVYRPDLVGVYPLLFFPKMLVTFIDFTVMTGAGVAFYFVNKWNQQRQENQQLQLAKREAELELLQSQVEPHFIFNTLNNIYALSLKNSPQTPDMIYRLSSLLDYTLYDSKSGQVPLRNELDYINNYLNLQQIRYGTQLRMTLNADPVVDELVIAPLLLLPFVENCFKHGVCHQLTDHWIEINLSVKDNALQIRIENSKDADDEPATGRHGIGLRNVSGRLAILYRDQHTLVITNQPTVFTVQLTIALAALRRPVCQPVQTVLQHA